MRRRLGLAFFALACGCASSEAARERTLTCAIEAMGGRERLSKIEGITWRSQGVFLEEGGIAIPFHAEWSFALPLRFRWTLKREGSSLTQGTDGSEAWEDTGDGPRRIAGEPASAVLEMAADNRMSLLLPLEDRDVILEGAGDAVVHGRPARGLRVSALGGLLRRDLFFDRETGLLVKSEGPSRTPGSAPTRMEVFLSEYCDVSGVRYPHRSELWLDGRKVAEETIVEIRLEPREEAFYRMPR